MGEEDLDPHILMWDVQRRIDLPAVPDGRTVVQFSFTDIGKEWWLVINGHEGVDLCDFNPGFDVHVRVVAGLATLTRIWRGDTSWAAAVKDGRVVLEGNGQLCRSLPRWLLWSMFAEVPRPATEIVSPSPG